MNQTLPACDVALEFVMVKETLAEAVAMQRDRNCLLADHQEITYSSKIIAWPWRGESSRSFYYATKGTVIPRAACLRAEGPTLYQSSTGYADPPGMKRSFRAKGERKGRGGRKGFATDAVANLCVRCVLCVRFSSPSDDESQFCKQHSLVSCQP